MPEIGDILALDDLIVTSDETPVLLNVTRALEYSWAVSEIPGTGSKQGGSIAARYVFRPSRIKWFDGRPATNEPEQAQASEWITS